MPHWIDHIIAFIITIALPLYGFFTWKKFKKQVAAGKPYAKIKAYVETIIGQWALSILLIGVWIKFHRSFNELGLQLDPNPDFRFILSLFLAGAGCTFLFLQWIQVKRLKGNFPDSLRKQIQNVAELLPATRLEFILFLALSLTAGICEELLYRGFLLWYISFFTNIVTAIVVCILVFGVAHAYQGRSGIVKTAIMGAILMGLYIYSGSLLGPMLLHCVGDITGGLIGSEVIRNPKKVE
jgi:membrane protease YdiL (CAAX protease family)